MNNALNATATTIYNDTVATLQHGQTALVAILSSDDLSLLSAIADVATSDAATEDGKARVRLFMNRISWTAGTMRKSGTAPRFTFASSTAKGKTTIRACEYKYNENKAKGPQAKAADATTDKPAEPTKAEVLAAQLADALAALAAEREAHAATRAELDTARAALASVTAPAPIKPATRQRRAATAH